LQQEQTKNPINFSVDFPERALNRLTTFFRLFAAIPILIVLGSPRTIFDFVEDVQRWALRVEAYALLLITDRYPPSNSLRKQRPSSPTNERLTMQAPLRIRRTV
jgi:hypothetical protein